MERQEAPSESESNAGRASLLLILLVAAGILLGAAVAHLALFGHLSPAMAEFGVPRVERLLPDWAEAEDAFVTYEQQPPPIPVLQDAPTEDLVELTALKEDLLSSYGWVDPEEGIAHIPIERAMQLIVEQGLPSDATPESTPDGAEEASTNAEGE